MTEPNKVAETPKEISQLYKSLAPKGLDPALYLKLVKEQIMGNKLTTEDFQLFLYVCKRTGLDPLARQIYAIPRWDSSLGRMKMTIQTSIDGFRLIAQRTGQYLGQDDIVFEPTDSNAAITQPIKATCIVKKIVKGHIADVVASARWSEYVQTDKNGLPMGLWQRMPYAMLGKCAESLALRKAFPDELSGVYTTEEMGQADSGISELPTPKQFQKSEEITVEHGAPMKEEEPKVTQSTGESIGDMRNRLEKEKADKDAKKPLFDSPKGGENATAGTPTSKNLEKKEPENAESDTDKTS